MRKNTLWIRTWIAAIAAGGLWVAMTQQPPQQPLTVEKLADDLHVIVGSGGNVGVLTTAEGVILVDDKFDRNVPEILEKVRSITDKPVRYVVNTHHHGDHSGGNTTLIRSAAAIVAHDNVYTNMVKGEQPGPPQITFSDKAYVRLGGKALRAHHFGRGHTNGDAVILFTAHRVIHMGDLFVAGTPFIDYAGGGSAVEWTKTIDKALTLDFDRVIPGHGPIMTKAELGKWNDTFKALRSKASELKRKGVTKEEMANQLKLEEFGWKASANWGRSVPSLYDEL